MRACFTHYPLRAVNENQGIPVIIVRNKVDLLTEEVGGRSDEELRRDVSFCWFLRGFRDHGWALIWSHEHLQMLWVPLTL